MPPEHDELVRLIGDPKTCLVRRCSDQESDFEVLSPGIGLYDMPPPVGSFVQPGSFVGYLTILKRYYHLVIPEGCHGVVTKVYVNTRKHRVEYSEPLFVISTQTDRVISFDRSLEGEEAKTGTDDVPQGMFGVRSPTDGIFYRRPNPQSPPYVEVGTTVTQGTVLGLVEVMKCFNPIVYPGEPEFPSKARVSRIVAEDASEVKHGEVLFILEPI